MAANLARHRLRILKQEIIDDDGRALLGKTPRDGGPETLARAGNQRGLPFQAVH
jgi:hypothetical protein